MNIVSLDDDNQDGPMSPFQQTREAAASTTKPHEEVNIAWCADLACTQATKCKKIHVEDFLPSSSGQSVGTRQRTFDVPSDSESDQGDAVMNGDFCMDLSCGGGKGARACGKKHEWDFPIA